MALTYVTVTRPYGAGASGTVELQLMQEMSNGRDWVPAGRKVAAALDSSGVLSVVAAANTDPDTRRAGARWLVRERIAGRPDDDYLVVVPHDQGATVRLDALPRVSDSDSSTTSLDARLDALELAGRAAGAAAGPRPGLYEPGLGLYGRTPANWRRARAALGRAAAGLGGCRIAYVGDSLSAGPVAGQLDPATVLAPRLAAAGYRVGEIIYVRNSDARPAQWTALTGWADTSGGDRSVPYLVGTSTAAVATYASSVAGTIVDIVTLGTTAALSYSIDGGDPVTITPSGQAQLQTITVTGLADTVHTVTVTAAASGTSYLLAAGVRSAAAVTLVNAGQYGARCSDWSPAAGATRSMGAVLALAPDLTVVELVTNDSLAATAVATYRAQLQGIVDAAKTVGGVLLCTSPQPSAATAWGSYVGAVYDVADAAGVPLLDHAAGFGSFAEWSAAGLALDSTHLNEGGVAVKVGQLVDALGVQPLRIPASPVPIGVAGGLEVAAATAPRYATGSSAGLSGRLRLAYFTATRDVTIGALGLAVGDTTVSGSTMSRLALFEASPTGAARKVAQTGNAPNLGSSQFGTDYASLATAGGFPASYTLRAGRRYAIGWLQVATTPAALQVVSLVDSGRTPVASRMLDGQTDIADSYTAGQLDSDYRLPYFTAQ